MTKELKSARRFVATGVFTAFMLVGFASANAQNVSDGLIAYWPFDSDLNDAVGDSHGEGMGSDDIAFSQGQWGSGIELDGVDQYVETPLDNEEMFDFQDGTGFSISAWYKVGEFTKSWQALIAKGEGNRWRIHRRGGEQIMTGNGGNGDVPAGTPDINDGEFHHIVLVSDPENDEVRLYSDGELASSNNGPAIQSNENPMMIGENPDARNRTWSGIIDDVGIWNRPLTEEEIQFLAGNSIASALGTQLKVGLNFGVDQGGSSIDADVSAGLVPQTNWNNLDGGSGSASDIVADDGGASVATDISVEWVSNNSWASTGGGEENNDFEDGGDRVIFTGYLDTGAATTTSVTITGIPQELQDAGYSVICYIMGGVPEKGGGYWVEDASGNVLTDVLIGNSNENSSEYIEDPGVDHTDEGNYVVLKGVKAGSIVVKAATADGLGWAAAGRGAIRAPINAIQLVPESSGRRVVGQFSADWTEDVEPEGTYMSGVAAVGDEFLHITDAANGSNGGFMIEDFSNGAVFTDFEISFRFHMSDSTCCGSGDDTTAAHRPADGLSINIANDLPDLVTPAAEEGAGTGIRINFDTWDSGGGEAPAIDVWSGATHSTDGGGESNGLLARQKFNGVTGATEDEMFKDANGDFVWMWTQGEWIDVKISVLDGMLTINYKGHEVISQLVSYDPLAGPNWLFGARTGGANETHWIDDLSITLYGSTAPGVSMFEANAGGFDLQITDIEDAGVEVDSVNVTFDGEVVETSPSKVDGVTSISYASAEILAANSDHELRVSFKDTNGKSQLLNLDFTVKDYTLIDASSLADTSLKGESGFLVYPTQISSGQGVVEIHGNSWKNAEKQINGEFIDPDMEEPYLNEADIDSFEGWSYYPEIVQVVNQNQDAPAAVGNFNANNGYEDEPLTGIPGWGDSTDGVASEYIALLDLERGAYKLGVNSDDGFSATIGANFGDLLAQQLGLFNGGRGASDTLFEIFVDTPGLYPFRVSWWEGGGGANIEIFSFVNGEKTLINDPDVEGSIKAYTITGAVVDESTTVRATTGRAKVVSVSPTPGDTLVKSTSISVVIQNEDTTVKQDTAKITLNGEAVDASVSKDGNLVTISYAPDGGLPVGTHTVAVSFEESNGIARGTDWSFSVPGIYKRDGDVPTAAQGGLTVREYHGIGTTDLNVLFAADKYPDSPDLTAIATYFEWPQSGDINVNPVGNVRDNYGWHLMGYIHPPESGEYIFAVATDDNSQLWLSTDSDPANAVQLTQESTWTGVRNYLPGSDESTSSPVFLEAGKVYFIECFAKEGGGGDNMAVAWSMPEDGPSDVDAGSLPISGEFLSPYTWTGPQTPELGSVTPTGIIGTTDYTVSVTINNGQNVKVTEFTKLEVDGNNILGDAESTLSGISSSISADGEGDSATEYTVLAEWKNSDGSTGSTSWSFMTSPHSENALYIEVEDFNYDGGEWMTFEETAGGGAYDGLEFVADIDIHNGGNANPNYRVSEDNHPGMADSMGFDGNRGDFDMDFDFKMGWNDAGDWYNYTRDFPAKVTYYNVIGRFSSGGAPPNNKLSIVTSDPTEADQTLEDVGVFQAAAATACWDCFEFFPMTDATGNLAAVKIGGETTVRLSIVGGNSDLNYLMFVPSAIQEYPPAIVSTSPTGIVHGSADLEVVLKKREVTLADAQLSVNGQAIDTAVATDGNTITITGTATDLTPGTAVATVSYNGQSSSWTFTVPEPLAAPIDHGDGTITYETHVAWEWWDGIGGAHPMEALTDNARYPDSPDGATFAPSWNTRTALTGGFEGNGRDNYGGRMSGVLTAPETGTYRFFIASDDHGLLRISTDADPANAVRVAEETGCCKNFTLDDGGLSGTVDLVEGQQYYMEALLKEGGGGDWMTVGWRKPSEDIDSVPGGNQEGIPGEYFTGTVRVPALPALSASVSPGNDAVDVTPDGSITLSISEGATTLDVASVSISLNGTKLEHTVAEGTWSKTFSIVSQEGKTYSITAPTGKLGGGSQNAISVTLKDSAGTETTIESSFRVKSYHVVDMATGVTYIEAEDFNYDGGSYKTLAEVGTGGSYDGLGAVSGIDFNNTGNASELYRVIPGNHPGMADSSWDSGRSGFSMEVDFKMGWNDDGDWYNYTRDFAAGSYAVYGRFSSGGAAINNKLSIVTGDATAEDQTIEDVGTFTGDATGGWNTMKFFPLNDADGELAVLTLDGTSTVRLTKIGGNMDVNYLALVPYEQALLHSAEVSTVKFIEAEDFDFDGGSFKTFEEVGLGGSYAGLGAETGIDINNSGNASELYRVIPGKHPGMADSSWDAERGGGNGFSMEVDFKMGWNDAGDWYNYTRDFPEGGSYAVYGRFSSGGNPVAVDLSVVTAGQGTEDQTLESVGTFTGPATGGWNTMQFFPLKDADGNLAAVELSGQSTVRLTILPGNVDMNYLAFVPVGGAGGDAPALSIVNNGDGTVTVTFEGTLQAAPTVNGPWQDVDGESPLTIPSSEAQQYGRAVSE